MSHEDIKSRLVRSRESVHKELALIREARRLERGFLRDRLRTYVLAKYLLTEENELVDDFDKLAELSLAKSSRISKELVAEFDTARSCDGATSVMVKKVLLLRSIERELEIELDAARTARIKSLNDLTDIVWDAMAASEKWSTKLL